MMVWQTGDDMDILEEPIRSGYKTAGIASADLHLARPCQAQQGWAKQIWTWLRRIEVH